MSEAQKERGGVPDICDRLGERFLRLVPLKAAEVKGRKRPSAQEIRSISAGALDQFFAAAREERVRHRLGVIGRARVAFGLQQRLLKAGYPPPLVKQVLFALLAAAFTGDKR
ncbi:MAG TPA: hypothetical protein VF816_05530 [Rhodocyclaceae bacterium]